MTLFTDQGAALTRLRDGHLTGVLARYLDGHMPSPESLWASLLAAEAEVARKLQVSLEPLEVFAVTPPGDAELTALAGKPYVVDPGIDLPPGFFDIGGWGTVQLPRRPLIAVHEVKFVYPMWQTTLYTVPPAWILPDASAGQIQFLPTPSVLGMPISVIGAQVLSNAAGQTIPQVLRVRYTAGLQASDPCMPDVIDLILRLAALRLIKFAPQSGSISADGLSQSSSSDTARFQESIDAEFADLRQRLLGPQWSVL